MYHYWVRFWDEVERNIDTDEGLMGSDSYANAATKLLEFYGKQNVYSIKLEEWEDILVKEDVIEGLTETDEGNG